jgi:hypothetical protein
LKKSNPRFRTRSKRKAASKGDHGAEGMHEAIQDIVKAMGTLKKYLYNPDMPPAGRLRRKMKMASNETKIQSLI